MDLELRDYLRILRKRRRYVIGALLLFLATAGGLTATATPVYEAETKLFVGQRQVAVTDIAQGQSVTQLSFQLLRSYAAIVRTRPIAEQAVDREGLSTSPTELARDLRADPILDTQIIQLRYQSMDPVVAQRTVNAVAAVFVDEVARLEPSAIDQNAEPAVRVSIVEPALRPEVPVSPRPARNMALALVLGMMLGVGLALVAEYLDTTVKDRNDVEQLTGAPLLAQVPRMATSGEARLERDAQSQGAESYRKLRTALQFLAVDHPLEALVVTSPFAREGKTTTAVNLASSFANAGLRTLLIEADLRRPTFQHIFPSEAKGGLTTVLIGSTSLHSTVRETGVRNLQCLPAGALPPNPAELLASDHMASLLRECKTEWDMVIVDAPPVLPVADASALAPRVDGVLLVARAGETKRDRLLESAQLVHKVGARLLGTVLNATKAGDDEYGYYYYGYKSQQASSSAPSAGSFEVNRPAQAPDPGQVVDMPGRKSSG